jgi:hypothetical protein
MAREFHKEKSKTFLNITINNVKGVCDGLVCDSYGSTMSLGIFVFRLTATIINPSFCGFIGHMAGLMSSFPVYPDSVNGDPPVTSSFPHILSPSLLIWSCSFHYSSHLPHVAFAYLKYC